jgi:ABC-type dipeptide/oligopeptide/nickel transport system permease component
VAWPRSSSLSSPAISLVQAGVLFPSILFITSNLLVDLSYGLIDPRIRHHG